LVLQAKDIAALAAVLLRGEGGFPPEGFALDVAALTKPVRSDCLPPACAMAVL
jgi:hypothetical protein